jgi:hypothetical protein
MWYNILAKGVIKGWYELENEQLKALFSSSKKQVQEGKGDN